MSCGSWWLLDIEEGLDEFASGEEKLPAEDQSPPPPEDEALFGEDDYGANFSDRESSVTNNADADIAAVSDLDSIVEEPGKLLKSKSFAGHIQHSRPVFGMCQMLRICSMFREQECLCIIPRSILTI